MQTTESPLQLRLWTVDEYHRMAEAGIFEPSERVELRVKAIALDDNLMVFVNLT